MILVDDNDNVICCFQVQQLEAGKVKLEADLNQVGAVLVNPFLFVSVLVVVIFLEVNLGLVFSVSLPWAPQNLSLKHVF